MTGRGYGSAMQPLGLENRGWEGRGRKVTRPERHAAGNPFGRKQII